MQVDMMGFPAGLFGTPGAAFAPATAGTAFGQTLGLALAASKGGEGGVACLTPLGADAVPAAGPANASAPITMAQLLTTAAPLAPAASAETPPNFVTTTPLRDAMARDAQMQEMPAPTEGPPDIDLADRIGVSDKGGCTMPAPERKTVPAKRDPQPADATPGKAEAPATAGTLIDFAGASAPEAPAVSLDRADMTAGAKADQPDKPAAAEPERQDDTAQPADKAVAQPDIALAPTELVAGAPALMPQATRGPEQAPKAQASPSRQIGEVSRKRDGSHAAQSAAGPAAPEPDHGAREPAGGIVAGGANDRQDRPTGDRRDEAPPFPLRHEAHAAPSAHAPAAEPGRATAMPAVAEPEPVIAARPGHLGQSLGVEIARKVEAGTDMVRVRLSPDTLGKVEVTLAFDDGGTLRATVRAESAQALELLRHDAPDLGRALDQAGVRADAQSFRFESQGQGGGQPQQQPGQQRSQVPFAGADEPEATQPAYREIRGDGQIDLLA